MRVLLLIVFVAGIAAYLLIPGKFEQDITLNGKIYQHVINKSGGDLVNHFYTKDGKGLEESTDFIQLIEFEKEVPEQSLNHYLQPLQNRYQMKEMPAAKENMMGQFEMHGMKFLSLGSPVSVAGKRHYLIYVGALEGGAETPDTYAALDQINALHRAVSQF